jgi:high-affinity iron transporter
VDLGSFASGLVTGLREGVEAALIVSIILAYLARTGNRRHFGRIWAGTIAAILASILAGIALFLTLGELPAPYEQVFEAGAMLVAAGVVTWMLFWMRRQAASVKGELQARVDRALTTGTATGLAVLAFTAVIREGLETSLFLFGLTTSAQTEAAGVLSGAVVGLGIAALLGLGFYRGARLVNLRSFFRWTGIGLIFIAAGLLASAIHELVEIGWIGVGTATVFDVSNVLPHEAIAGAPGGAALVLGEFLRALLGYTSQPEAIALTVWLTYIVVVLGLFLRPSRPLTPVPSGAGATPAG